MTMAEASLFEHQEERTMTAVAKVEPQPSGQVVTTDAATLAEVIARAARDPAVDVDKMERLMQMAERLEARHAERAFNEAMKACQAEMPRILKNKKNTHTNSTYANLDAVITAITPVYTKHGFGLSFGTADGAPADHYRVTCLVSHEAGFSREYHADIPADTKGAKGGDTKTATHGFGSSMSYGRRYLTLLIFNISTTDDDCNGATGTIDDAQYAVLDALVTETKADLRKFLVFMGVDALWAIPASKFNQAKRALEAKRAKS
jgi:hypothetical protein